jgi:hypothetical protein
VGGKNPELKGRDTMTFINHDTAEKDPIPWRAHDTDFWGSEGCFTGKTINSGASVVTAMETLREWGVNDGTVINGRLTNNDNRLA